MISSDHLITQEEKSNYFKIPLASVKLHFNMARPSILPIFCTQQFRRRQASGNVIRKLGLDHTVNLGERRINAGSLKQTVSAACLCPLLLSHKARQPQPAWLTPFEPLSKPRRKSYLFSQILFSPPVRCRLSTAISWMAAPGLLCPFHLSSEICQIMFPLVFTVHLPTMPSPFVPQSFPSIRNSFHVSCSHQMTKLQLSISASANIQGYLR